MADESDRFALGVDDALGSCDVVFERKRRILDDAHVVAVLLQAAVDTVPAGAVHEAAVDEDNILGWAISHEKSPLPGRVVATLRLASPARKAVAARARPLRVTDAYRYRQALLGKHANALRGAAGRGGFPRAPRSRRPPRASCGSPRRSPARA